MCVYTDVISQNQEILLSQVLTIVVIIFSALFWITVFKNQKMIQNLIACIFPVILWIIFGSLDILITVKGTFGNPNREGNPLAKELFKQFGFIGPAVASFIWIFLWVGVVFLFFKFIKSSTVSNFLSRTVFYSLFIGHLIGFSSWWAPLCGISNIIDSTDWIIPGVLSMPIILLGTFLALIHGIIERSVRNK